MVDYSFHIKLAEVRVAEDRLYVNVAIDRTSKFALVGPTDKATIVTAAAFLSAAAAAPAKRLS